MSLERVMLVIVLLGLIYPTKLTDVNWFNGNDLNVLNLI